MVRFLMKQTLFNLFYYIMLLGGLTNLKNSVLPNYTVALHSLPPLFFNSSILTRLFCPKLSYGVGQRPSKLQGDFY